MAGWVAGWSENWRVMLNSTQDQVEVEVRVELGNKKTLLWYDRSKKITKPICVKKKPDLSNLANSGENQEVEKGSENART